MQTFIGFENHARHYNSQYVIADALPSISTVASAFVSPVTATIEGNFLEELEGGVFDADGALVAACLQPRSDGRNAIRSNQVPRSVPATNAFLDGAVFGGVAFDHFGHFLLEATARLWCLPEHRDKPWLFLTSGREELLGYQMDFLRLMGLSREQIVVVCEGQSVDHLIVPEPAFTYHHHVSRAYADTFRRTDPGADAHSGRRVFLSRGDTTIARTVGEHELEDVLKAEGWDIVVPERLPAAAQAAIFRSDNVVMGLQGSAMHLGLFGLPGRRVIHLCRGQGYRGYYILDDLVCANATYLHAMRSHALASKPITGPFLLDFETTIAFLRDQDLISRKGVAGHALSADTRSVMEADYEAWWHYTESQIRFHRQIADDGTTVDRNTALDFALRAAAIRPQISAILCHALALAMKFEGMARAASLLRSNATHDTLEDIDDAQLLYFVCMIHESEGDYDRAIDAGRRCVARAPTNPSYVNQLATTLYRRGLDDEALDALTRLVAAGRALAENHFLLSLLHGRRGDRDAAVAAGTRAVHEDRTNEGFALHLADLLAGEERLDEVRTIYLRLADRIGASPGILRRLIDLETRMGLDDDARSHLVEAYRHTPADAALRDECVHALVSAGRLPDISCYAQTPTPAAREQAVMLYKQSQALTAAELPDRAVYAAARAVELDPKNPTILQALFSLMLRAKRPIEAHLLARILIDHGHGTGSIFYVVSLTEVALGRLPAATDAARRAVELEPANDIIREHFERLCAS